MGTVNRDVIVLMLRTGYSSFRLSILIAMGVICCSVEHFVKSDLAVCMTLEHVGRLYRSSESNDGKSSATSIELAGSGFPEQGFMQLKKISILKKQKRRMSHSLPAKLELLM